MKFIHGVAVLVWSSLVAVHSREDISVSLPMGVVEGRRMMVLDHEIDAFFGIPYAKPPLGDLRYKKPLELNRFPGNKTIHTMPPACFQINPFVANGSEYYKNLTMSEDCLYLNLWVPRSCSPNSEPKAVLVWIYGGGFTQGSTRDERYKGEVLAALGKTIVASINYRVGAMGFLNGGTRSEPGNLGLYDQALALKWIKNNIGYFGGNPGLVTIFGESAGSFSVGFHLTSPLSSGLFQRGILQSGVPNTPLYYYEYDESLVATKLLAKYAKCTNSDRDLDENPEAVMRCLREQSPQELAKAEYKVSQRNRLYMHFLPVVGEDFIPYESMNPFAPTFVNDRDILIGMTKNEGSSFLFDYFSDIIERDNVTKSFAIATLQKFMKEVGHLKHAHDILKIYFRRVGENDFVEVKRTMSDVMTDWMFRCPSYHFANLFTARHNHVFFYYFTHLSSSLNSFRDKEWAGVMHFQDVQYVFGHPFKTEKLPYNISYTPDEERFSHEMIELWSSFAKNGVPESHRHYFWPTFSSPAFLAQELNSTSLGIFPLPNNNLCRSLWAPALHL